MRPLSIEGAFALEPAVHRDARGSFHEWFTAPGFEEAAGHPLSLAQASCSVSRRGVLRGIHFASVPPGQAKYVTCVRGAVWDVLVDLRAGSPTYLRWEALTLGEDHCAAVYAPPGLGHGFLALTDDATMIYLSDQGYAPEREHTVDPFDPRLAIDWPAHPDEGTPSSSSSYSLSARDAGAPGVAEAEALGVLPLGG